MKIEYLGDLTASGKFKGVDPEQLVRLFDFDEAQVARLRERLISRVLGEGKSLDLSLLDFIEPVNCELVFTLSTTD